MINLPFLWCYIFVVVFLVGWVGLGGLVGLFCRGAGKPFFKKGFSRALSQKLPVNYPKFCIRVYIG
jgi:hypothetical protein